MANKKLHPIERFVLYLALSGIVVAAVLSGAWMKPEKTDKGAPTIIVVPFQPPTTPAGEEAQVKRIPL